MKRKILVIILVICVLIIGVLAFLKVSNKESFEIEFTIESGEATDAILEDLVNQDIIGSKNKAYEYVVENGIMFYPNTYLLETNMELEAVFSILNSPISNIEDQEKVVVVEGQKITDLADQISNLSFINESPDEILKYWSDESNLNSWIEKYTFITEDIKNEQILYPLEGYFLPATFTVDESMTLADITTEMLDFSESTVQSLAITPEDYHKTATFASIVERETLFDEDKPKVASVFYNRLNNGMKIQSDITVLYAMQSTDSRVLYEDLEYDSPYNTYVVEGLPPGPIASPSVASFEATLNPASTEYYYFFAIQDTGEIIYSKTYEEHQQVSSEYAWDF